MKRAFYTSITFLLLISACNLRTTAVTQTPTETVMETPLPTPTELPSEPPIEGVTALPLPSGLPVIATPSFNFIDFQDANNGWGIASTDTGLAETGHGSDGYILRSMDGGLTWFDVTPPGMGKVYVSHLSILDVNTVWMILNGEDFFTGTLYHTTDGGATWTSNPIPFGWANMQFLDLSTGRGLAGRGVAAGSEAVEIYQTSDGGLTWTSVFHNDPTQLGASDSLPFGGTKNGMTFLDANTGWVTGSVPVDGNVYLYVTHDGGVSWAQQSLPLPAGYENNQYMPSAPVFFGQDGFLPLVIYFPAGNIEQTFYVTHDGGTTWSGDPTDANKVVVPPGHYSFADALNGLSWNGGTSIYFTSDGAQSWGGMFTTLDKSDSLAQIDFINATTGWALTGPYDSGLTWLYRTEDGGATWTQLIPEGD